MKNLFGIASGLDTDGPRTFSIGRDIPGSILDIRATVPIKLRRGRFGRIVTAGDPVAADATCARLMAFEPNRIVHLNEGVRFLGNASRARIDQVGETIKAPADSFQVVPKFRYLCAK